MPKQFKIKAREVQNLRKELKKKAERSTSGPRWATKIKEDTLVVRFLANPDNGGWVEFQQAWDAVDKRYLLALEENEQELKDRDLKLQTRYYAPALDVESNDVIVLELPVSLIERLQILGDKKGKPSGDLTSFDIELYKSGTGIDTQYFADPGGASDLDLSQYTAPDLWALLETRAKETLGIEDDDDDLEDEVVDSADEDDEPYEVEEPVAAPKKVVRRRVSAAKK